MHNRVHSSAGRNCCSLYNVDIGGTVVVRSLNAFILGKSVRLMVSFNRTFSKSEMLVHYTSLITLKNKIWVHNFKFLLDFRSFLEVNTVSKVWIQAQ